jgi:hypothetical protein
LNWVRKEFRQLSAEVRQLWDENDQRRWEGQSQDRVDPRLVQEQRLAEERRGAEEREAIWEVQRRAERASAVREALIPFVDPRRSVYEAAEEGEVEPQDAWSDEWGPEP